MSSGNITREDIRHEDIVDAVELASDGQTSIIFTAATVVSTTSGTKTVVLSGVDILRDPEILENGDIVILSGTSGGGAADGTYTVDARVTSTSFTVQESIADSTGGSCEAQNPSGASKVGFDPSGLVNTSATDVQEALSDLDGAVSGVTAEQHKSLRQLIHFIDEGPAEGFTSGAYREQLPSGDIFPTSITWYTDSGKTDKIVERLVTWSGATVTQDKWKIYDTDGSTVLWTVSDAISYSGIVETVRTRTITSGDA